jgi:hypothetical protein
MLKSLYQKGKWVVMYLYIVHDAVYTPIGEQVEPTLSRIILYK